MSTHEQEALTDLAAKYRVAAIYVQQNWNKSLISLKEVLLKTFLYFKIKLLMVYKDQTFLDVSFILVDVVIYFYFEQKVNTCSLAYVKH